ncbi:MAG: peptidoglycan bridge formation glycyltransferase FemA/FemB family protein [Patescibacteria group bacterium]
MSTSLFQTPEWGDFKCQTGWSKQHRLDGILVLEKKLPLGRTMLYSPMINEAQGRRLKAGGFLEQIKNIAQKRNAIFYRVEFDTPLPTFDLKPSTFGARRAFEEMQPEHTLILDITQSEEEILAQMKPKGRYNIKVAERSGIEITESTDPKGPELDSFYTLYESMAKRQRISYRDKKYFEALLEILGKKDYARLYDASVNIDGKTTTLASAIVGNFDRRVTYLFGGSSNEHRNLMAPYLLHWQIIKDARAQGCTEYDLFGIAPNDDPKHPWAGVTRFKKQFGGREVHLAGNWDLVFRPVEYQSFKIVEKIRR